jgi:E3 ubiquitin-protein ligase HUWE1
LFEKSSSGSAYQPNPKSYVNPDHLNYFKFIGRFIGKALVEKELIDAYFTRAFYKMILGQELEFKDLEAQDYDFYKSM